jgi:hypothetical protein
MRVVGALVSQSRFANEAIARRNLHVALFGQWLVAYHRGDAALSQFIFDRFPEPLKSATTAWRATNPFDDPSAPSSPFAMPQYTLAESAEEARWDHEVRQQSVAAERAGELSDRYLLFTVIFATVLFFAGISGKFKWRLIDRLVLTIGALALTISVVYLLSLPIA